MTWVIGSPTMFGYSVGLADIQATIEFRDGSKKYLDCVQKLFIVGKFLVAGYSGSIEVGFSLIDDLKQNLLLPDDGSAWIPSYIIPKWSKRAKWLFSQIKPSKRRPVSLLIVGVHPGKDNGIPGMAMTYGCIMKSPDFTPELISGRVRSIGSGNDVQKYKEAMDNLNTGFNPLMKMEIGSPGMYGQALALNLSLQVGDSPEPGISKHFHIAIVKRGEILFGTNNRTMTHGDGSTTQIKMPPVAENWKEFSKMMKRKGINLAKAKALG